MDSILHFADDNNWIQFSKTTSKKDNKDYDVLKCSHKTLHSDNISVPIIAKKTDSTPASFVALTEGDYIAFNDFNADKAGHITGSGTKYFRMPYYNYDLPDNAHGFKRTHGNTTDIGSVNGGNVTVLDTGDYFSTNTINLSDNGRITGVTTQYFKLPFTDFESDLTTIQNDIESLKTNKAETKVVSEISRRVSAVENGKVNTSDFTAAVDRISAVESGKVNTSDFTAAVNRIASLETVTGTTIPATYAPLSMTGNIKNIYVTPGSATITSTIGQVDGDNGYSRNIARVLSKDTTNVYTVSESLSALAEKALENSNTALGVSARVTLLINRLKELGIDLGDSIK